MAEIRFFWRDDRALFAQARELWLIRQDPILPVVQIKWLGGRPTFGPRRLPRAQRDKPRAVRR